MKVFYPYNEILPKKTAHDVYIFNECCAFADQGIETVLLCGRGSLDPFHLGKHYQSIIPDAFSIRQLPIVRKNNPLNLSWNLPFFLSTQREIKKQIPDFVFLSVLKQANFHLKRKVPGVRYLFEVHQLNYYPGMKTDSEPIQFERSVLERADVITVTTQALKDILLEYPYRLKIPIEVIPLAVKASPIPYKASKPFTIGYVGQLYEGQGIPLLLEALADIPEIHLKILGGKPQEIHHFKNRAQALGIEGRVDFKGFIPPSEIPSHLEEVQAFVAPFEARGRMPYVAHTKLLEYATWGRPLLVPNLPVVREHFSENAGVLFFEPDCIWSLKEAFLKIQIESYREKLQREIYSYSSSFLWENRINKYINLILSKLI